MTTVLTYDSLLAELFPRLTSGVRWGLDRTARLLAGVGDPHRSFRVVHIGGTNGKGSIAAHVDSVLRAAGQRTGFYSSPHLCTFRERIRIDGTAIGEAALLSAAERLWPAIEREAPSFFEATTAIAFLALAEAGVNTAVVEVGLGGRLDATNVVVPDVVVLSSVGIDHVEFLGDSVERIAAEKAGIIKPGAPVVTGETDPGVLEVFRGAAAATGTTLRRVRPTDTTIAEAGLDGTEFVVRGTGWGDLQLRTPLAGHYQAHNAALAVHALDALPHQRPDAAAVVHGIARTRWPGRLQVERLAGVTWIFDVAHNAGGMDALATALSALPVPRPVTAVAGILADKDWRGMLARLCTAAEHVVLTTAPTTPPGRRWDPAAALAAVPHGRAEIADPFGEALQRADEHAQRTGGSVVVTGSVHTVGDALAALGLCTDGADAVIPGGGLPPGGGRV